MISSQTYLISDGILRIIGPLFIFDIVANFASLLLARFGTSSLHSYHGYLEPIGGNCPLLDETCISGSDWSEWGSVGCPPFLTNTTTFNTTEFLVPFNSIPRGETLSLLANPLNSQEVAISDLGIVYGIVIIAPALLFLFQLLDSARWLGPFRAKTGFGIVFATGSIVFMGIIAGVILPPSIALVQHPPTHVFIDSLGPGGPIFHPEPDLYAYNFTGGDSTHWSDCFNVTAPSDHFGFWGEWWAAKEDRVAHVLAVL
jgi:hypothetical protein